MLVQGGRCARLRKTLYAYPRNLTPDVARVQKYAYPRNRFIRGIQRRGVNVKLPTTYLRTQGTPAASDYYARFMWVAGSVTLKLSAAAPDLYWEDFFSKHDRRLLQTGAGSS